MAQKSGIPTMKQNRQKATLMVDKCRHWIVFRNILFLKWLLDTRDITKLWFRPYWFQNVSNCLCNSSLVSWGYAAKSCSATEHRCRPQCKLVPQLALPQIASSRFVFRLFRLESFNKKLGFNCKILGFSFQGKRKTFTKPLNFRVKVSARSCALQKLGFNWEILGFSFQGKEKDFHKAFEL